MIYRSELSNSIGLRLNKSNNVQDVLFLSGAGISVPPPANFPLGNDLHKMVLQHSELFSKENAEQLSESLIFEETISRLTKLYSNENGINTFLNALSSIFSVREKTLHPNVNTGVLSHQPNDYHKYFNWHIQQGGKHLTVNIDKFIESLIGIDYVTTKEKIENLGIDPYISALNKGLLVKIHGDVNLDEWEKQGYLYENVQAFTPLFKQILDEQISSSQFVIFIGYGGVDKYDITPYFNEKSNGFFENTNALWIDYGGNEIPLKPEQMSHTMNVILSKFNRSIVLKTIQPELVLNNLFNSSPLIENTKKDEHYNGKEVENFLKFNFAMYRTTNHIQ